MCFPSASTLLVNLLQRELVIRANMASSQGSALADASNKQLALPTESDVRDFSSKVDEVSMLVDGLSKGTISPQYVDSKLEADNLKVTTQSSRHLAPADSRSV